MSADEKRPLVKGVQDGQASATLDNSKSTPIPAAIQGVASAADVALLRKEVADLTAFVDQLGAEICAMCEFLNIDLDYDDGCVTARRSK
jgi:hypothetical protein